MNDSPDTVARILQTAKVIAVVGASANPDRPSHDVMAYLQRAGYRAIPVNPGLAGRTLLGEKVYARLQDIPVPVDLVDIFRRSSEAGAAIDDAIAVKAKAVWLQLGIFDEAAVARAKAAGLDTVVNRCTKIEHGRLTAAGRAP